MSVDWEELESAFFKANEMSPDEQAGYVEELFKEQPLLSVELVALLEGSKHLEGFLEEPIASNIQAFFNGLALHRSFEQQSIDSLEKPEIPEDALRIGVYCLLDLIGEGGMGKVFRAWQEEPVQRIVALKILKTETLSLDALYLFKWEQQVLAMMDHEHIARVYDAGTTDEGLPYFTMEYIDGCPIVAFADEHHLDLESRIKLFLQVCDGMAHAHQKGIVHRDLKPSNILVTQLGQVKIIDFGIARSVDGLSKDGVEQNRLIGTPSYMSPEQADPLGGMVDTRSDIYALGAVLYFLISGRSVIDEESFRRVSLEDKLRIIREVVPLLPSQQRAESQGYKDARARKTRGDLDSIVMKTLSKKSEQRYPGVDALALDLTRFLLREPVSVGPSGLLYPMGKYLSKHRHLAAAFSAAALGLVLSLLSILIGWSQTNKARIEAELQLEKRTLTQVFLEDILKAPNPYFQSPEVRLSEVLLTAESELPKYFHGHDDLAANMRQKLGETFSGLGLHEKAKEQYIEAICLFSGLPDTEHQLIALSGFAFESYELGDNDKAMALYEETLGNQAENLGVNHPALRKTMIGIGNVYRRMNLFGEAERCYTSALETDRALVSVDTETLFAAEMGLANLDYDQGDYRKAANQFSTLLPQMSALLGSSHPKTERTRLNLGVCALELGQLGQAETLIRQVVEAREKNLGKAHPLLLNSQHELARVVFQLGRLEEAVFLAEKVVKGRTECLGNTHPDSLEAENNLAVYLSRLGQHAQAATIYESLIDRYESMNLMRHPRTLRAMNNYADVLLQLGRLRRAEEVLQTTLATQTEILGPENPRTLMTLCSLGEVYIAQKQWGRSVAVFSQLVDCAEKGSGVNQRYRLLYRGFLGHSLVLGGDLSGRSYLQESVVGLDRDKGLAPYIQVFRTSLAELPNPIPATHK